MMVIKIRDHDDQYDPTGIIMIISMKGPIIMGIIMTILIGVNDHDGHQDPGNGIMKIIVIRAKSS